MSHWRGIQTMRTRRKRSTGVDRPGTARTSRRSSLSLVWFLRPTWGLLFLALSNAKPTTTIPTLTGVVDPPTTDPTLPSDDPVVYPRHGFRTFEGYDCSSPKNLHDIGYDGVGPCVTSSHIVAQRNVTYRLLQKEKYRSFNGYSCRATYNRVAFYCGVFDHITPLPLGSFIGRSFQLTKEECRRIVDDGIFQDVNRDKHVVERGKDVSIKYYLKGKTYNWNGEVKCEGVNWKFRKENLEQMVVEDEILFTIRQEEFRGNQQEMTAFTSGERLPCAMDSEGCTLPNQSYTWKTPKDRCYFSEVQTIFGTQLENKEGEQVFMSLDGSLIRLIIRNPVLACGTTVYATHYNDMYLDPMESPRTPFTRHISESEMSLSSYVRNRDEFLYHHVVGKVRDEFRKVLQLDCQRRQDEDKINYYLQVQDPGLMTWFLGNATFATTAGEVLFVYQCQRVRLHALRSKTCYDSLKVEVLPEDKEKSLLAQQQRPIFMEPLTRRLTLQGVPLPCSSRFVPKYRNIEGEWTLVSGDDFQPARAPTNIAQPELYSDILDGHHPRWEIGGLYTVPDLEDMERYQDQPRFVQAFSSSLSYQLKDAYVADEYLGPDQVFPKIPDPSWITSSWTGVLGFITLYGSMAALIIGFIGLLQLIVATGLWCYHVFILRDVHGCSSSLWWSCCTSAFLMRQYRYQAEEANARFATVEDEAAGGIMKGHQHSAKHPLREFRQIYKRIDELQTQMINILATEEVSVIEEKQAFLPS